MLYFRFIEMYTAAGVPIWGITTTNEPINGLFALATFNSLGWTMREMVTDCAAKTPISQNYYQIIHAQIRTWANTLWFGYTVRHDDKMHNAHTHLWENSRPRSAGSSTMFAYVVLPHSIQLPQTPQKIIPNSIKAQRGRRLTQKAQRGDHWVPSTAL